MPDLPNITPEVMPGARLSSTATPDDFGAGVARGIQSYGDATEQLYRVEQQKTNQVATMGAYNQLSEWENQKLHHPKTGLLNQNLGPESDQAVDDTLSDYNQTVGKIAGGLTNDAQKQAFARMADQHRTDVTRTLYQYAHKQNNDYANEQAGALVANSQQSAVNNAITPDGQVDEERISLELEKQRAAIIDSGARNGAPPELVNRQMQQAASATNTGVVERMLNAGNDTAARAWFDKNRQNIVPAEQDRLEKSLQVAEVRSQAAKLLPSIVLNKDGQVDGRAAVQARLMDNREAKGNPKVMAELQQQADLVLSQHDAAVTQQQNQSFQSAYDTLQRNDGDLSTVPATLQPTMRPDQWETLKNVARKTAKGEQIHTDSRAWLTLDDLASDQNKRAAFLKVNLLDYADRLSTSDLQEFKKRQNDIRTGAFDTQTKDAMIKDVADSALILTKADPNAKPGTQAAADNVTYLRTLRQQVDANEKQIGKPLTRDQVQKVADDLLIQRATGQKGFFGGDVMAPTYKIPDALSAPPRLGDTITPVDQKAWTDALTNPHATNFDTSVQKLQLWSAGVDDDGQFNPALQKRARTLIDQQISPGTRQDIIAAFRQTKGGEPTDAQILSMWASHKKRTTPIQQPAEIRQQEQATTPATHLPRENEWDASFR